MKYSPTGSSGDLVRDGLQHKSSARVGSGRVVTVTPEDNALLILWAKSRRADGRTPIAGALHDAIQLWAAEQEALARRGDRPETEAEDGNAK